MLWIVIAVKSLNAFCFSNGVLLVFLFKFIEFSCLLLFLSRILHKKSNKYIKRAPKMKLVVTGTSGDSVGIAVFDSSKAGRSSDHIDAENIIPDAKPIVRVFISFDGFGKKNIRLAPSVVSRQGSVNDKIIDGILLIFFR